MALRNWFSKPAFTEPVFNSRQLRILTVSISAEDTYLLRYLEDQQCWRVRTANSPQAAFPLAACGEFDVILCGHNQPGYPWREVMERLSKTSPESSIFLVSPVKDDYLWCDVLSHGGSDILIRPLRSEILLRAINQRCLVDAPRAPACRAEQKLRSTAGNP